MLIVVPGGKILGGDESPFVVSLTTFPPTSIFEPVDVMTKFFPLGTV